jgi:hypothetical protein
VGAQHGDAKSLWLDKPGSTGLNFNLPGKDGKPEMMKIEFVSPTPRVINDEPPPRDVTPASPYEGAKAGFSKPALPPPREAPFQWPPPVPGPKDWMR